MVYLTSNLSLINDAGTNNINPKRWAYQSADAIAVVRVNGYIDNAKKRGMKVGDIVDVRDNDAVPSVTFLCTVAAINTNGSANLSDGINITGANTD